MQTQMAGDSPSLGMSRLNAILRRSAERPDVLSAHRQHTERDEERPLSPEQQVLEVARAVRVQGADFSIEDRGMRPHRVGNLLRELRPGETCGRCRDEGAVMPLHMGQGPEAVHLGLKDPVGVVEGMRRRRMAMTVRVTGKTDPAGHLP